MRFLFDACIPRQVAQALNIVNYDVEHVQTVTELPDDADDADIIEWCKKNDAVLVTGDYKLSKTRRYAELLKETGVSVAFFRPPSKRGWTRKEWFWQAVKRISRMEEVFSKGSPRYFRFKAKRVEEIPL